MQARTADFIAQADAASNSPVLLVRLITSGLTKYLTSRLGVYGATPYEELLVQGLTLNMQLDRFGRVSQSVGNLTIANGADVTMGVRFSDLLSQHVLDNAEVQADLAFMVARGVLVTGSSSRANTRISAKDGVAHAELVGVDLSPYCDGHHILEIADSTGKKRTGYMKTPGSGETFLDIVAGWSLLVGWTAGPNATIVDGDSFGTNPGSAVGRGIYKSPLIVSGCLYRRSYERTTTATESKLKFGTGATQDATDPGLSTGSDYRTGVSAYPSLYLRHVGNGQSDVSALKCEQVLTPSVTGATIVSAPGGSTYNWASVDAGFNDNDSAGYSYTIVAESLPPADWLRVFKGVAIVPEQDAFDDREFHLQLQDEGQPAAPEVLALRANRIHKVLGTRITTTTWPKADPDVIGAIEPEIYGRLEGARALPVDAGVTDVLAADMDDTQSTIPCSDATAFGLLPTAGSIECEDEEITYTGKDTATLTLTGCTRGATGTTPAAHDKGRPIWQLQPAYVYLVAHHACKSVTNVVVDGVLQTSGYTVDLTGPTTITFTSKPRRDLRVAVTQQPVHVGTTTAEQSPGGITTTSEQSPGAVTTTAEHSHSTDTGSHSHATVQDSAHEYQSSPSIPATFNNSTWFSFANAPVGGSAANWHIKPSVKSGTWWWQTAGGGGLQLLTVGDNYFTEASPSGGAASYELHMSSAGQITIDMIERDVIVARASSADAATGVSASRTGSTASSMSALAGATATLMSSLAGSTAVSVSRTQDVVVSGADIEVGQVVTCDVEGYRDDGSGTYTGTPNALITNPADQLRHIVGAQLGLTLADYIESVSFAAARAAFAAAGIRADWGLYEAMDSAELCERLRWSVAARLFLNQAGQFKLYLLPATQTPLGPVTEQTDVLDESAGGGPISVGRTRLQEMINHVWVGYAREVVTGNYPSLVEVEDATSQATYRTDNGLTIENDFVRDATAAATIAARYLAWHKDVRWRAVATLWGIPWAHLELLDQLGLSVERMPGGWGNKAFRIEGIRREYLPPGQPSRVTLTLVEV